MTIKSKITQRTLKTLEKITGVSVRLGHLLAAIREAEDISLSAFAQKLGVSKQYLCDLEHHRKLPSPKLAAMYAEKLGYSPDQFIRLALQEKLHQDGFHFQVELTPMMA
jgi:transcriptional regulator with XRE-family HTH domain